MTDKLQESTQGELGESPDEPVPEEKQMGFIGHLIELRDRLLRSVLVIIVIFVVAFPFANDIYHILAKPLVDNLPEGGSMIATGVISPFLTPIKLAFIVSIFAAFPYLIYQAWAFIAPGLYKHEKKLAVPLIASSAILFYVGIAFAYFIVLPNVFTFMMTMAIDGVNHAPDITYYLDFTLKMFFAFGIAFEVPIATILLVLGGVTTPQSLAEKRPYIVVGAFVFGMLLTPPDPASQVMLAIPMWILFEIGLIFSRLLKKKESDEDAHKIMSEEDMDSELDRIEAEEESTK
ncbi:Twin-arginine translocation protein TatC [hydrothermal vent metagenome]|uniref:Twin-arginine translocation protein TatC n=1 Tax=hydrothermal vent metagenome TaxID=652676 RepID=A0A3B0YWW8_9ZZZZ